MPLCMEFIRFFSLIELFNMLINPTSNSFALRWHRDDVKENATEDEERKALSIWHHGVSFVISDDILSVLSHTMSNLVLA